jgi:RNA polymerase sigma-70 factor (ECF subfamily)
MSHAAFDRASNSPERIIQDLFRQVADKNPEALSRLYDLTSSMVFGVALRILPNRPDAEEVTLDVYVRVWQSAIRYNPDRGSVIGLLLRMTRNLAIDRLRFNAARISAEHHSTAELDSLPGLSGSPEAQASLDEYKERVSDAMVNLTPDQRHPLELAFFRGMSHTEIADHLGVPLGTVKGRIRAGLAKLRSALAPDLGSGEDSR